MKTTSSLMNDPNCPCGAQSSADGAEPLCGKCRARNTWQRRAAGRKRHPRGAVGANPFAANGSGR